MALSLVGDYGGSESSSSDSEEETHEQGAEPTKPKVSVSLPSAADLFDSVDADSASFMTAPPSTDVPLATPKRKGSQQGSVSGKNSSNGHSGAGAKKGRTSAGVSGALAGSGTSSGASKGLIPPQMNRPNVVTEDAALWSSDASMKRRRLAEADKKSAAGSAGRGGSASKAAKDLTFKQREKIKRDKGQASRGKSYVEEEKRLLRELGSS